MGRGSKGGVALDEALHCGELFRVHGAGFRSKTYSSLFWCSDPRYIRVVTGFRVALCCSKRCPLPGSGFRSKICSSVFKLFSSFVGCVWVQGRSVALSGVCGLRVKGWRKKKIGLDSGVRGALCCSKRRLTLVSPPSAHAIQSSLFWV